MILMETIVFDVEVPFRCLAADTELKAIVRQDDVAVQILRTWHLQKSKRSFYRMCCVACPRYIIPTYLNYSKIVLVVLRRRVCDL